MTIQTGSAGGVRRAPKPTVAEGTTKSSANIAITNAGFVVGTVTNVSTTSSNLDGNVTPALTDVTVTPLGTSINYTVGVFSPPNFFAPPGFFGPPGFFSPPGFFGPPGFFAPPSFK